MRRRAPAPISGGAERRRSRTRHRREQLAGGVRGHRSIWGLKPLVQFSLVAIAPSLWISRGSRRRRARRAPCSSSRPVWDLFSRAGRRRPQLGTGFETSPRGRPPRHRDRANETEPRPRRAQGPDVGTDLMATSRHRHHLTSEGAFSRLGGAWFCGHLVLAGTKIVRFEPVLGLVLVCLAAEASTAVPRPSTRRDRRGRLLDEERATRLDLRCELLGTPPPRPVGSRSC